MTKILLTISTLLVLVSTSFSQSLPVDPDTKLITYAGVVEQSGVAKSDLFLRATTWFTRTFNSGKSVLEVQDKESGKIIGKGLLPIIIKVPLVGKQDGGTISTTITILCKDGKYKYIIDNLSHNRPFGANTQYWVDGGALEKEKGSSGMMSRPSKKEWNDIKFAADEDIKSLIESLKKAMAKGDADF